MSDAHDELLDATIRHLQELRGRGVRYVSVTAETLEGLNRSRPPAATARKAAPTSVAAPVSVRPPAKPMLQKPVLPRAVPAVGEAVEDRRPAEAAASMMRAVGTPSAPPSALLSPQAKEAAFAELRARALACVRCPNLAAARKTVVFGVGDIHSRLLFVGEAPGADEDEQGEPFVGKAGQLLTKIIQAMGLSRESVYIANILKCRPDTPGQSAGNRKPTPAEMATCLPFLEQQIDLIRPEVIVALGATAVEGLLGKSVGITKLRGHWQTYRGIPLMPTYHPAYLLRNQAKSEKRRVWEDMMQAMERIGLPLSEKQRGYFL